MCIPLLPLSSSYFISSVALRLLNIDKDSVDPIGGRIDRDKRGEPTGILRESATELLRPLLQQAETKEQRKKFIRKGLEICTKVNILDLHKKE